MKEINNFGRILIKLIETWTTEIPYSQLFIIINIYLYNLSSSFNRPKHLLYNYTMTDPMEEASVLKGVHR